MADKLSFVLASCQYPPGLFDRTLAEASYERLALELSKPERASINELLLVGDQIYVDATAGLFDPAALHERYVRPYDRLYGAGSRASQVSKLLTTYAMLDDHEIQDDWEPEDDAALDAMRLGRMFFLQRMRGVETCRPYADAMCPLWMEFELDGFPFFLADTRTERTLRTAATIESARIMSNGQFESLTNWLARPEHRDLPKFVACPSIVLPRRLRATHRNHVASALRSDAWDGYPGSHRELLAFIADNELKHVVFLSGDEHLSCVSCAFIRSSTGKSAIVHSVHSSPLYGPFPFANSVEADLAADESFGFAHRSGTYSCDVATRFAPPGDGFAILDTFRDNADWMLRCEFSRAGAGSTAIVRRL